MFVISFIRVLKFSLQDLFRNIWLSLVIIIILCLALFSVNTLYVVKIIGDTAVLAVKEKIDINLYLNTNANEQEILSLKTNIENIEDVKEVIYISKAEALESFKEKHKDNPEILESLKELSTNPLAPTLVIKPQNIDSLDHLTNQLNVIDSDIIESRNFADYELMLSKINGITTKVSEVGMFISLIFVIITLLVVYNSVRVAIYTHRDEIRVMRLVGASNWFIQMPYLFSSIIYTMIGMCAIVVIFYPFLSLLQPYLETFFVGYNINILAYFKENFFMIFGVEFIGAAIVNMIASLSAIRIYTKV